MRLGNRVLQFGNAGLVITLPAPDSSQPISVTASAPGTKPVTLTLEHRPDPREFPPNISMVEMDAGNTTPEFFISRFSGGAHCCAEVQILDVVQGQWRIVDGGRWDGDEIIPEDIDGDGEQEIVHGDDRFLYRYTCYACAAPPLRVFKLVAGTLADVTASPLYRFLDEKGLTNFQQGCANHDNGACASYVAAASRLGRRDEAWKFMLEHYDRKSDWGLKDCALMDDQRGIAWPKFSTNPIPTRWRLSCRQIDFGAARRALKLPVFQNLADSVDHGGQIGFRFGRGQSAGSCSRLREAADPARDCDRRGRLPTPPPAARHVRRMAG